MTFGLAPGKLGFKIGDVLVGLQSGTTDTPETISSTQNKLHTLGYAWNPDSLAYEVVTTGGSGTGLEVTVTNASLSTTPYEIGGDAGGRTRVSQLTTLFDGKTLNADDTRTWDNRGTGTYTFTQNLAHMSVTAGQYYCSQAKHFNPYFSGKSQFIEVTFDNFQPQTGVTKRVGYFSSNAVAPFDTSKDGFWLESDGATIRLIVARAGTEVLNKPLAEWDQAALMASYNWQNFTVCAFDFLWLGGAVLRFFVKANGRFMLVHQLDYAGTAQDVFMQSPNQPVRYEIRSSSGSGSFRRICSQVATEGSFTEEGDALTLVTTTAIAAAVANTIYAVKGVRKAAGYRDVHTDIVKFGGSVVQGAGILDSGRFLLLLNPTLSAGLTWAANSRVEEGSAAAGQTVTNVGRILDALEIVGAGDAQAFPDNALSVLRIDMLNTADQVILAYQPFNATQEAHGHITLKED